MMQWGKLITDCRQVGGGDLLITVLWTPSWLMRLFGYFTHYKVYRGNCAVWRTYPECEWVDVLTTDILYAEWKRREWSRADMKAHLGTVEEVK